MSSEIDKAIYIATLQGYINYVPILFKKQHMRRKHPRLLKACDICLVRIFNEV